MTNDEARSKAKEICDRWTKEQWLDADLYEAIAVAFLDAYEKGVTDGKVDLTKLVMGVFDRLEGEVT